MLHYQNTFWNLDLADEKCQKLPKYGIHLTRTYKLMEKDLQTEAYNVLKINDLFYFMGPKDTVYKKLDHYLFLQIQAEMPLHDRAKL